MIVNCLYLDLETLYSNRSGIMGNVSNFHFFHVGSYSSGVFNSHKCPIAQVIMAPLGKYELALTSKYPVLLVKEKGAANLAA